MRGDPSTADPETGMLYDGQSVNVVAMVKGENWLVGSQTWVSSMPAWTTDWHQLDDGSYVYSAFVFTLAAGRDVAAARHRRRGEVDRRQPVERRR